MSPAEGSSSLETAPVAPREPTVLDLHGVRRVDDWYWLRDIDRPETLAYLRAERGFYEAQTAHTRPLRELLFGEMTQRTLATDQSVRWADQGSVYYTQTVAGKEYEQFLRVRAEEFTAEVLLDGNELAEADDVGGGRSDFFELGVRVVSPNGRLLAYSVDRAGDEVYAMHVRDLDTRTDLPDRLPRTYYGAAWSADSTTLFYVVQDSTYRPHQVWRHRIGTDAADDVLVYEDPDDRFELTVEASRSGGYIVITTLAKASSEVWLVPADRPEEAARVVEPRRPGVLYSVAHAPRADPDEEDRLVIVTDDGAPEFRLMSVGVDAPGRAGWTELVGEDPAERLMAADVFADHVVLTLRRDVVPLLRIVRRDGSETVIDVHPGVPGGSIALDHNEDYVTDAVIVEVSSYTEPAAWYSVDLGTGDRTLLKRDEVPGYDPSRYVSERLLLPAADGRSVPVTVARRADVPLDGTAPCLLYGYGAYEWTYDPEFDRALPSLLDHGVVFAHAHVRGGGEGGRRWWLEGSLERKQNTFADFVAVADGLAAGLVDPAGLVARGLSAGGLLAGAVFSQAPQRWAGVIAEVPFVDVVTTMLDESIPLTAQEWEEWGDPRRPEDFAWMLAYSPYDNPPAPQDRPPLLVTGAMHDPRVMYWEPAKWVAKLRADGSTGRDLLLRMELGEGSHTGPSGRFAHLSYEAEIYAWVLDRVGRSASR